MDSTFAAAIWNLYKSGNFCCCASSSSVSGKWHGTSTPDGDLYTLPSSAGLGVVNMVKQAMMRLQDHEKATNQFWILDQDVSCHLVFPVIPEAFVCCPLNFTYSPVSSAIHFCISLMSSLCFFTWILPTVHLDNVFLTVKASLGIQNESKVMGLTSREYLTGPWAIYHLETIFHPKHSLVWVLNQGFSD